MFLISILESRPPPPPRLPGKKKEKKRKSSSFFYCHFRHEKTKTREKQQQQTKNNNCPYHEKVCTFSRPRQSLPIFPYLKKALQKSKTFPDFQTLYINPNRPSLDNTKGITSIWFLKIMYTRVAFVFNPLDCSSVNQTKNGQTRAWQS